MTQTATNEAGESFDLTSNTGKNDPNSTWGSGLLTFATGFGTAIANIASAFRGKPKPVSNAPAADAPGLGDTTKTLLIAGGVVLAVVAIVFLARK